MAALDTIYRATSDASSYFIDLEFLFVSRYRAGRKSKSILIGKFRSIGPDCYLLHVFIRTFLRKWYNTIGLYRVYTLF